MKTVYEMASDRFKGVEAWTFPVFVAIRVTPIVATAAYVFISPLSSGIDKSAVYWLLAVFLALSFLLWSLFFTHRIHVDKLLYVVLAVDLAFITLLVRFTGGFSSEFYLVYLLLCSIESIYFGLGFGILVAVLSSVSYVSGNWDSFGDIYWMHLGLRLFFFFAVALLAGFFSTRLKGELDRRLGELTTLYEIGKSIHSTLELDKLLAAILDLISIALRLKSTAVLLAGLGEKENTLKFVMTRGFPEEADGVEIDIGEDCVGWVMREGKPLLVDDAGKQAWCALFKGIKTDVASFMAVPLVAKGENTGVLCATDPRPSAFTEDNVRLLTTVAGQISIAIDNARLYEETKRLSETDGLTGLYDSRTFYLSLDKEVSRVRRYGGCLSVLMADMDHFKRHNDSYGHPSGDEVLRVVAEIMMDNCRSSDVVARYGGEEFAAVLIDTDEKEAMVVAERIRRHVEGYKFRGDDEVPVVSKTISLGVAVFPGDSPASGKEELVKRADDAMYRAKKGGRNRVCVWGRDGSEEGEEGVEGEEDGSEGVEEAR